MINDQTIEILICLFDFQTDLWVGNVDDDKSVTADFVAMFIVIVCQSFNS